MSPLRQTVQELLLVAGEVAVNRMSEWTILRRDDGGLEMISGSNWSPEALRIDRGALEVYQVTRQGNTIRVEGRAGLRSCRLETAARQRPARLLPFSPPTYFVMEDPFRASSARLLPAASD